MTESIRHINCFISSPNDVGLERDIVENALNKINHNCLDAFSVYLQVRRWESLIPKAPNIPGETIQDMINKEVEKSHVFILILWKRYGHCNKGFEEISNTERELNAIIDRKKKDRNIEILAYFRNIPENDDPGKQENKIIEFRERLRKLEIFNKAYQTPDEFEKLFIHDFYGLIFQTILKTPKKEQLQQFWKLGEIEEKSLRKLAIIYPPVNRKYMDCESDENLWFKRLEPTIYFEDYKAIVKIINSLDYIGNINYEVIPNIKINPKINYMNRCWICVPRSRRALVQLENYQNESRFIFLLKKKKKPTKLIWKLSTGEQIEIKSPLGKYLEYQRKGMKILGEWHHQLSQIVGKDYAILARFKDTNSHKFVGDNSLYDYFIAGIRGLGTWGAATFIKRKYSQLANLSQTDNLQLLLEVTYQDGHLVDAVNVTDIVTEDYIREQNDLETIKHEINRLKA